MSQQGVVNSVSFLSPRGYRRANASGQSDQLARDLWVSLGLQLNKRRLGSETANTVKALPGTRTIPWALSQDPGSLITVSVILNSVWSLRGEGAPGLSVFRDRRSVAGFQWILIGSWLEQGQLRRLSATGRLSQCFKPCKAIWVFCAYYIPRCLVEYLKHVVAGLSDFSPTNWRWKNWEVPLLCFPSLLTCSGGSNSALTHTCSGAWGKRVCLQTHDQIPELGGPGTCCGGRSPEYGKSRRAQLDHFFSMNINVLIHKLGIVTPTHMNSCALNSWPNAWYTVQTRVSSYPEPWLWMWS